MVNTKANDSWLRIVDEKELTSKINYGYSKEKIQDLLSIANKATCFGKFKAYKTSSPFPTRDFFDDNAFNSLRTRGGTVKCNNDTKNFVYFSVVGNNYLNNHISNSTQDPIITPDGSSWYYVNVYIEGFVIRYININGYPYVSCNRDVTTGSEKFEAVVTANNWFTVNGSTGYFKTQSIFNNCKFHLDPFEDYTWSTSDNVKWLN